MLEAEYKMCVETIKNLGIQVSDDYIVKDLDARDSQISANSRTLGLCCHSRKTIYVRIEGMSYVDILSTLCHEIIHTNRNCNNHGAFFKMYASIVNKHFRKSYPNFACGYHEAGVNNNEYVKNNFYSAKYVIYSTQIKKLVQHTNKRCKVWSQVNACALAKQSCNYDVKGGDGFSLIALEKIENGYVYYDRHTSERKIVKNLDMLAEI